MQEHRGLTAEMYQAIVAIADDRLREVPVTREGFERIEGVIAQLAEAQTRTEQRVGHLETRMDRVEAALERLAEVQARTEERVGRLEAALDRLAQAQARTEAHVEQLAQAQARTEAALQQLTRQVGGLSETVGGDIRDCWR
jgi:chromosome segregation ATPase